MAAKMAGWYLELLINGVPQSEFTIFRHHRSDVADRVTLSNSAKLILAAGEVVQLRLTVEALDGRKEYIVLGEGSSLKVERMRLW